MPIDELSRRKFEIQAGAIARALIELNDCITKISQSGVALEAILVAYLDGLERVSGTTPETEEIRALIDSSYARLNDPSIIAALESVGQDFSDAAEKIGRIAGALP